MQLSVAPKNVQLLLSSSALVLVDCITYKASTKTMKKWPGCHAVQFNIFILCFVVRWRGLNLVVILLLLLALSLL